MTRICPTASSKPTSCHTATPPAEATAATGCSPFHDAPCVSCQLRAACCCPHSRTAGVPPGAARHSVPVAVEAVAACAAASRWMCRMGPSSCSQHSTRQLSSRGRPPCAASSSSEPAAVPAATSGPAACRHVTASPCSSASSCQLRTSCPSSTSSSQQRPAPSPTTTRLPRAAGRQRLVPALPRHSSSSAHAAAVSGTPRSGAGRCTAVLSSASGSSCQRSRPEGPAVKRAGCSLSPHQARAATGSGSATAATSSAAPARRPTDHSTRLAPRCASQLRLASSPLEGGPKARRLTA